MSKEVVRLEVCADMLVNEIRRTGQDLSNANATIRNMTQLIEDLRGLVRLCGETLIAIDLKSNESDQVEFFVQNCLRQMQGKQDETQYDLGVPGNEEHTFADPICNG